MTGDVTYLYAYDIAHEANLAAIETRLRGTVQWFHFERLRDAPRSFPSYRPLILQMDDVQVEGPLGLMTLSTSIKLFSVGAVSVKVSAPISCESISDLVALRNLTVKDSTTLDDRIGKIAARLLETIKPQLDSPVKAIQDPEVYTIFRLDALADVGDATQACPRQSLDEWIDCHRGEIAALLVGEEAIASLSEQEIQETLIHKYSYYRNEVTILDWDAAFLIDSAEACQDTIYVIEVANVQLEELKTYDVELDKVLDKAYDDVEATARPQAFGQRQRILNNLREIHMDLTQVTDELSNITKFIGDWHLARIYMSCVARFHLSQWQDMVTQKRRSLDSLYTMLQQDSTNRAMLILELAIVALCLLDLIVIVVFGLK